MNSEFIIITGCSKGLGYDITKFLLERGESIIGFSRSTNKKLIQLTSRFPSQFIHITFDLSELEDLENKFKSIIKPYHVKGLINNAGVAYDDILTNGDISKIKSMFDLNVFAPFVLTKYFIRKILVQKSSGSIVHISSISGHTGYKGLSYYAASKIALEGFSKNTAREWGEKGIRSNCIVCGFMETEMSSSLDENQKNRIYNRTSLKKPTQTQTISEFILFLLNSNESITGQSIFIDSGTI